MYSTKTPLVIRADLPGWQIANVAAFLSGGLAGTYAEIVGESYRDADGRLYSRAVTLGIRFAIYTEALFKTTNDVDNRASVATTSTAALDFVGLGLHADRKTIDKITGGLKFMA